MASVSFVTIERFNDNLDVTPDGAWKTYLDQEIAANNQAADDAAAWAIAFAAQAVIYFALWDDAVNKRDGVLDHQREFQDYLRDTDIAVDFEIMKKKQTVLTELILPSLNVCFDPMLCMEENVSDGDVVDGEAKKQARTACGGVPAGWTNNEGRLYSAAAAVYAGGFVHNANKRRIEGFRKNKTNLTLQAQRTAVMSSGPIMSGYTQSAAIFEGLSGIFLQGFQSAGAGLGVSLNRLADGSGGAQQGGI